MHLIRTNHTTHPVLPMLILAFFLVAFLTGTLGPLLFGLFVSLLMEILPVTAIVLFIIFLANR